MNSSEIQFLWKIYDIIKSWVEYSERKNAVLFTIVGFEMGILKFFEKQLDYRYLEITNIFLIFAFIIALVSFYPKTDRILLLRKTSRQEITNQLNLLFFGDIQKLNINSFIKAIEKRYHIEIKDNKLAKDLCDQIFILSKIAYSKFIMFKVAVYFAILGQLSLFLLIGLGRFSLLK